MNRITATLSRRMRQWRRYRQILGELKDMSRRDLTDLGIDPHRLESLARRASRM